MGVPVHLGAVLCQLGVAQNHQGVRGVEDQEGDLLLVIPRDPQLEGNGCPGDPAEPLPIKRIGH